MPLVRGVEHTPTSSKSLDKNQAPWEKYEASGLVTNWAGVVRVTNLLVSLLSEGRKQSNNPKLYITAFVPKLDAGVWVKLTHLSRLGEVAKPDNKPEGKDRDAAATSVTGNVLVGCALAAKPAP